MKEEIYFAVTFSKNPAKYIIGNRALLFGVIFLKTILDHEMNHFLIIIIIIIIIQTLTIKDCKGPQTNMPKNVGSIKA